MKNTGPSQKTRQAVYERDGRRCVICWHDQGLTCHHRLPRGRGGRNSPENLLTLCGSGTHGCHGLVERMREWSYRHGFLVRTGAEPGAVPVTYLDADYLLTSDGRRERVQSSWFGEASDVAMRRLYKRWVNPRCPDRGLYGWVPPATGGTA